MEYLKETIENVIEMVKFNYTAMDFDGMTPDAVKEKIYDDAWIDDAVTGNGSGSYYFSNSKSRDAVEADRDTVEAALREFCVETDEIGRRFLDGDYEYFDVTARCYVLGEAVEKAYNELDNEGFFDIDGEEEEGGEEE
jgi:hypothetical protein